MTEAEAAELIRGRVIAGIHTGRLNPGDRLPTYREVAAETGIDLRAVARIYRTLEKDGLVDVRGRSGVFVAEQERVGGDILAETAQWLINVLHQAWTRRITLPEFPEFVRRCIATTKVRCICVESTEDQLESLCAGLREFGLEASPVHADRLITLLAGDDHGERVPPEARQADLFVTTAFHAARMRPLAAALDKPITIVRLNHDIVRRVESILAERDVVVIVVDPEFLKRLRLVLEGEGRNRIRGVLVSDREFIDGLDPSEPILISDAARTRLRGVALPPVVASGPVISTESAEELITLLVRFNLEKGAKREG